MPVVKRPDAPRAEARPKGPPTISIRKPLPKQDTLIALITDLIKNKKLVYLSVDSGRISYEYIAGPEDLGESVVKWYLDQFKR